MQFGYPTWNPVHLTRSSEVPPQDSPAIGTEKTHPASVQSTLDVRNRGEITEATGNSVIR
jgi:hypothetical protein